MAFRSVLTGFSSRRSEHPVAVAPTPHRCRDLAADAAVTTEDHMVVQAMCEPRAGDI